MAGLRNVFIDMRDITSRILAIQRAPWSPPRREPAQPRDPHQLLGTLQVFPRVLLIYGFHCLSENPEHFELPHSRLGVSRDTSTFLQQDLGWLGKMPRGNTGGWIFVKTDLNHKKMS